MKKEYGGLTELFTPPIIGGLIVIGYNSAIAGNLPVKFHMISFITGFAVVMLSQFLSKLIYYALAKKEVKE